MCAGSVKLPNSPAIAEMGKWQEAFFMTNFTHTNYKSAAMTTHSGGHDGLWRDMLTTRAECFPTEHLIPTANLTLEKLLTR